MLYKIYTVIWGISLIIFNAASFVTVGNAGDFGKYSGDFLLGLIAINIVFVLQFLFSHYLIKETLTARKNDYSALPCVVNCSIAPLAIMLCGVIFMVFPAINKIYGVIATSVLLIVFSIISLKKSTKQKQLKEIFRNFFGKKLVKFVLIPVISVVILFSVLFTLIFLPNIKYNRANELIQNGEVRKGAYLLSKINNSKSEDLLNTLISTDASLSVMNSNIGDTIKLGKYEQDNNSENGAEEIEWIVLDKIGSKVLLISKYCLDAVTYNETFDEVTWEESHLRNWLNNDFYNSAFNDNEKSIITTKKLYNKKNLSYYRTDGGNPTKDNVFILSLYEAEFYLKPLGIFSAQSTKYSIAQGSYRNASTLKSWWWLRTPGHANNYAAHAPIAEDRDPSSMGIQVTKNNIAVRPAIWIELNK